MRYPIWFEQLTVTNPAVCHDKVVNQQFLLAQSRPMMIMISLVIKLRQGFFQGGRRGAGAFTPLALACPPFDMLRILFYM